MNNYKSNLNLEFLKELCRQHGILKAFSKGETLVEQGAVCDKIGYIESGYFHYIQTGLKRDAFITGFAFQEEFVTDYPRCLYGEPSDVTIVCANAAKVRLINASLLSEYFSQSIETERMGRRIAERIFLQTYRQLHDFYTQTAEERYCCLLARSPSIVQQVPLKELASYLRVTPTTISKIRRKITFGKP